MKLCVAIPCFFGGMDFCDAIRKCKELDFDTVETYNWKNLDLDKEIKILDLCLINLKLHLPLLLVVEKHFHWH